MTTPSKKKKESAELAELHRRERRAFAYIREKVDQLLTVMGTSPLMPEELDDEILLDLDPIGIISGSFTQVLRHLSDVNWRLENTRDEIRAVFDSAGAGILVLNPRRRIMAYNRKQAEAFGLTCGEAVGADCCRAMCRRGRPGRNCTFAMVMKSGEAVRQDDWTCKDRIFDVHGTPLKDATGEITSVVLAYNDVTEHKRVESELLQATAVLERQNKELRKLDKMKDDLLRDVSHELKTPVVKHLMQLDLLRPLVESDRLSDLEKRAFTIMLQSIKRQQGVIRNLLDLARIETGCRVYRREEFALGRLLQRVLEDNCQECEAAGMECVVEVPPIAMVGDEEMLWHVISNLVNNAIKFRRRAPGARMVISAAAGEDRVAIRVSDNGIGMKRKELEKVFDRFFQASPATEGSGVGLAICQRIVTDLGGRIGIESEGSGRGMTVTVTLPLEAPAPRGA